MSAKSKAIKSLNAKAAAIMAQHLFVHQCRSGAVLYTRLELPRPGQRCLFDLFWLGTPTKADRREKSLWLKTLTATASAMAGYSLTFILRSEPAVEMETAWP